MRSKTNRHTEISLSIESEKGRREWRETKEIYERSQLYSTALWCIDTGPFSSRSYLNEIASNSLSYTIYIFYGSTSTCLFASSFSTLFIDNERTITNTLWCFAHSVICLRFFLFPEGVFFLLTYAWKHKTTWSPKGGENKRMIEPHSSSLCMHSIQHTRERQHPDQVRITSHRVVSHSSHHQMSAPLIVPDFLYSSLVVITIAHIAVISDDGVCFSR